MDDFYKATGYHYENSTFDDGCLNSFCNAPTFAPPANNNMGAMRTFQSSSPSSPSSPPMGVKMESFTINPDNTKRDKCECSNCNNDYNYYCFILLIIIVIIVAGIIMKIDNQNTILQMMVMRGF